MLAHKITKISQIQQSQLFEFYKKTYFDRHKSLINEWRWWYRYGYNKFEPLVLTLDKKVIGQAGLQACDLNLNNKKVSAAWFLDFAIIPEFRGKGLGKILIKELMNVCPNLISFCNNHTLKIVKKYGWENNLSILRFGRPINIFKFTPILNKFKIEFANNLYKKFIIKNFNVKKLIQPKKVQNNFDIIEESFSLRKNISEKNFVEIIRDKNWLNWRIGECPYVKDLYFFEYKNNFSIVHIFSNRGIKRLNVLLSYFTDESYEKEITKIIVSWSIENNIDLVWAVKQDGNQNFNDIFPSKFSKSLNFVSWTSNTNIFQTLKKGPTNAEAIDSDIDSSMYVE